MATVLVGQSTAGTSTDFFGNGSTAAWPFVALASGTLATLFGQFKVANGSLSAVRLGIYSDGGPTPGTLLAVGSVSSGFTGTGSFSTDVSGSAVSIASGTTYWLAVYGTGEQVDLQGTASATGKEDAAANIPATFHNDGAMGVTPVLWGEDGGGGGGVTVKQLAALGVG